MDDPLIGKTIGHYRMDAVLGAGGMGKVYAAADLNMGERRVAIKLLHDHLGGNEKVRERFRQEALILAHLNHPNTVTVFEFLVDHLMIVMEFVDGEALDALMRRVGGPLPSERIFSIFDQLLSALDCAHRANVIHRDLKPANVLITQLDGRDVAKVLDFGIAKILGDAPQLTAMTARMGTMWYSAPEQIQNPAGVDARADIYALGITLYEAATGRVPFPYDTDFAIMQAQIKEAPTPPRQVNGAVPEPLQTVILKAIAKDPADRYQSAAEMREALLAAAGSVGLVSDQTGLFLLPAPPADEPPAVAPQAAPAAAETVYEPDAPSEPAPEEAAPAVDAEVAPTEAPPVPAPPAATIFEPDAPSPAVPDVPASGEPAPAPVAPPLLVAPPRSKPRVWVIPVVLLLVLGAGAAVWMTQRDKPECRVSSDCADGERCRRGRCTARSAGNEDPEDGEERVAQAHSPAASRPLPEPIVAEAGPTAEQLEQAFGDPPPRPAPQPAPAVEAPAPAPVRPAPSVAPAPQPYVAPTPTAPSPRPIASAAYVHVSPGAEKKAKRLNTKGMRAYKKGNYRLARQLFRSAVASNPNQHNYRFNVGCQSSLLGDVEGAISGVEAWVARRPGRDSATILKIIGKERDLDRVRGDPRFQALLRRIAQ